MPGTGTGTGTGIGIKIGTVAYGRKTYTYT